jgi:hypothetical protein
MSLPIGEAFSEEALERTFQALEVRPQHNPDHAFRVRVPREWFPHHHESMDRPVNADAMTMLGGWQAPGRDEDLPPMFHVQAITLEREITANFMLLFAALGHERPSSRVSPAFADALEQPIDGAALLVRGRAHRRRRAFVAMGVTRRIATGLEQTFGAMIASFRVLADKPTISGGCHRALDGQGALSTRRRG